MATTIYSITAQWTGWSPDTVANASQEEVLGEQLFRWGIPLAGELSSLGFMPSTPPSQSVGIGDEFNLGELTLYNRTTVGEDLESIALEITIRFNSPTGPTETFSLPFLLDSGDDTDPPPQSAETLQLNEEVPLEIEAGELKLTLLEFDNGLVTVIANEGTDATVTLQAILRKTPFEDEHCEAFVPVFDPDDCEVPLLCPIDDGPIIEDCTIPEVPEPIFDCPEIDLPITDHSGGGGDDGPPGEPGCDPTIQVTASFFLVSDCSQARVEVIRTLCPGECCYQFNFVFYLCYIPWYSEYGCCAFLWCSGVWVPIGGSCADVEPPTEDGRWGGELAYRCSCDPTTTTTTTTTPAPSTDCRDCDIPDELTGTYSDKVGDAEDLPGEATFTKTGEGQWVSTLGDYGMPCHDLNCYLTLTCSGASGLWSLQPAASCFGDAELVSFTCEPLSIVFDITLTGTCTGSVRITITA